MQGQDFKEGNRARWRGRASNPVGDGIRSRAGSTPAAFRHFSQYCVDARNPCRSGLARDGDGPFNENTD